MELKLDAFWLGFPERSTPKETPEIETESESETTPEETPDACGSRRLDLLRSDGGSRTAYGESKPIEFYADSITD